MSGFSFLLSKWKVVQNNIVIGMEGSLQPGDTVLLPWARGQGLLLGLNWLVCDLVI